MTKRRCAAEPTHSFTRRAFLRGIAALSLAQGVSVHAAEVPFTHRLYAPQRWTRNKADEFSLGILELDTLRVNSVVVPFLGHSVAVHPLATERVVVLPQRPERGHDVPDGTATLACEVNASELRISARIESPAQRHFFGHGTFSPDGRYLYATANDMTSGQGVLEVRAAEDGYRLIGEMPTYGAGPHQVAIIKRGTVAVICNYGTDPRSYPLASLDALDPSLSYVELASGKLLHQDRLPSNLFSIRHLAITEEDDVALGLYYEGKSPKPQACVALRHHGGALQLMAEPASVIADLASTALSLAIHPQTLIAGATHPAGNRVTFWDIREKRLLKELAIPAPQGITLDAKSGGFVLTTRDGRFYSVSAPALELTSVFPSAVRGLNWRHSVLS